MRICCRFKYIFYFCAVLTGSILSMVLFSTFSPTTRSFLPILIFTANFSTSLKDKAKKGANSNLAEILETNCISAPCNVNRRNGILKFFVVGDWGGQAERPYQTEIQRNLIRGLSKTGRREKSGVDFFVSVGDHFYPDGVKTVDDPRFEKTFENPFSSKEFQKRWFLVAGNHDHYKNITAQLQYTLYSKSRRWIFPKFYYKFGYTLNHKPLADFIATDSIILCGNTLGTPDEIPTGPKDKTLADEQWRWIEKELNQSKAPYLFVIGHYPVFSKGRHGPSTACFRDKFVQLMSQYSVTAYLTGHDHNIQHHVYYYYGSNESGGYQLHTILSGLGSMYNDVQSADFDQRSRSLFFYPGPNNSYLYAAPNNSTQNPHSGPNNDIGRDTAGFVLASLNHDAATFEYFTNGNNKAGVRPVYNFTVKPRPV